MGFPCLDDFISKMRVKDIEDEMELTKLETKNLHCSEVEVECE